MGQWKIGFETPEYLWLLLLVPALWWAGRASLSGLGRWRSLFAYLLRTVVAVGIIFALAGIQAIQLHDRVAVIYLLDQSDSIPPAKRQLMFQYALESSRQYRQDQRDDRVGLIVFGREASIEFPPLIDELPPLEQPESYLGRTDATNLEAALRLAQASFPENTSKRIVLVTDGNETIGSARSAALQVAMDGIGIDVVPVTLQSKAEIMVEKIDIPGQVRQGQPIEAKVLIRRYSESENPEPVEGQLRVFRKIGSQIEFIADGPLTLDRELNVIPIPHRIDQAAGYSYEAEFFPNDPSMDSIPQNNRATAFTYARGKGRILLIENTDRVGEYALLVDSLRRNELEVDVRSTSNLFSNLIELQIYDSIVLAGVARTTGNATGELNEISDEQIDLLVSAAQHFGIGIFMIGGPEAFGAGGWANTKLEEASPLNFTIKNSKVIPSGALLLVIDKSGSMSGENMAMSRQAAIEAVRVLGPSDQVGVIVFDSQASWAVPMQTVGSNRQQIITRIRRIEAGGGTDLFEGMQLGFPALQKSTASLKHMIALTDGLTPPADFHRLVDAMRDSNITLSGIAVGQEADQTLMADLAQRGGGAFHFVVSPRVIPRIFVKEALRVSKPLVFEPVQPIAPEMRGGHESLIGISESLPPIKGFVLTERKDSPIAEFPIVSPVPTEDMNSTILATWTYGLGRVAVYTSDVGQRWATQWNEWGQYDQFFSQLVRWTMRPAPEEGNFSVATQYRDGRIQVVLNAMDDSEKPVSNLEASGVLLNPELKTTSFRLNQAGPGRYVGEVEVNDSGAYILNVQPGSRVAPITTGVTVPVSAEYRIRQTNLPLLESMASLTPTGGAAGELLPSLDDSQLRTILNSNPFRADLLKTRSLEDVWPLVVVLAAAIFFTDCLIRRVAFDPVAGFQALRKRFFGANQEEDSAKVERLDRLRAVKSETSNTTMASEVAEYTFRPADANRWQGDGDAPANEFHDGPSGSGSFRSRGAESNEGQANGSQSNGAQTSEADSYTSRLLAAKRKSQKRN